MVRKFRNVSVVEDGDRNFVVRTSIMHRSHCEEINWPIIVRRNRIDNSLQIKTSSQTFNLYFAFGSGGWRQNAHIMQGVPLTPNANEQTQTSAWELSVSSEKDVPRDLQVGRE